MKPLISTPSLQIPALMPSTLKRLNSRHGEGIIVGLLIGAQSETGPEGIAWPITVTVQTADGQRLERHAWVYPDRRCVTYYGRVALY